MEYFSRLDAVDCRLPETVKAVFMLASLPASWDELRRAQAADRMTVSGVRLALLHEFERRLVHCDGRCPRTLGQRSVDSATRRTPPRRQVQSS